MDHRELGPRFAGLVEVLPHVGKLSYLLEVPPTWQNRPAVSIARPESASAKKTTPTPGLSWATQVQWKWTDVVRKMSRMRTVSTRSNTSSRRGFHRVKCSTYCVGRAMRSSAQGRYESQHEWHEWVLTLLLRLHLCSYYVLLLRVPIGSA